MLKIKRILFPTDFSGCAEHAYAHASVLAERFAARLYVLNVITPRNQKAAHPIEFLLEEDRDKRRRQAQAAEEPAGAMDQTERDGTVYAQMQYLSAAEGILEYADAHHIDLIVMGTHGFTGLDHLLMGSVAEKVVRQASCPVFTVREQDKHPEGVLRRVLVPVDFSEHARLSVTYAKELAAAYDARLDVLHVVQEAVTPPAYPVERLMALLPDVEQDSLEALEALIRDAPGANVPVTAHVIFGHPALGIVDFADRHESDLIVVGTHGLTGIKRILVGSVSENVIRMAGCPVFTVKSFGKSLVVPSGQKVSNMG